MLATTTQMMRLIFVSEQKRWEATQARAAATISTIYEEEELEFDETQGYDLPDQVDQSAGIGCHSLPGLCILVLTLSYRLPK